MANRDVEVAKRRSTFVQTLRRVADALEQHKTVRIQVAGKRIVIPVGAKLSIEHEVEGRDAELELQLSWTQAPTPRDNARPTKSPQRKTAKARARRTRTPRRGRRA